MNKYLALVTAAALLGGCAADLSEQPHSVSEYLADDKLSSATIEACRASNDAELRVMQAKPACVNVQAAERQKRDAQLHLAEEKSNAKLEEMMERRREHRESKQQ